MLALAFIAFEARAAGADSTFFPARPTGTLGTVQGTLIDYGHGNELGSFTITDSRNVKHLLYMGKGMQIGGVRVFCGRAPTVTYKPDTTVVCPDWPSNLTLGHSIVKAVIWSTSYQGQTVQASDSITVITP